MLWDFGVRNMHLQYNVESDWNMFEWFSKFLEISVFVLLLWVIMLSNRSNVNMKTFPNFSEQLEFNLLQQFLWIFKRFRIYDSKITTLEPQEFRWTEVLL